MEHPPPGWTWGTRLGEGGSATVFAATTPEGREVAVKVPRDPAHHERLRREADALGALAGDGVPALVGLLETEEGPRLVLERLRGESLAELAARARPSLARVRDVHAVVAATLRRAHAAGWVHRDVKPANVFLAEDGRVVLLDWGVAARRGEAVPPGERPGTPGFVPPELPAGAVDPAQDRYALAASLLRVATGLRPPEGGAEESLRTVLAAAGLPADWSALLLAALHPDPARRPPDAAALARSIAALGADAAPAAPTSTLVEVPAPDRPPPRRGWLALAAVALAGLAVVAAVWPRGGSGPDPVARCAALAETLASRQRPDGGFSGIPHSATTGWDTAQQLAGLQRAAAGCGARVGPALARGAERLAAQRGPGGWAGSTDPLVVATAWAALAGADGAVDVLLAAQNPDGSFGWTPAGPGHPYATVHALLALPSGPAASAAAAWVVARPEVRAVAGLDEEAFVALRAHGAAPAGAAEALLERIRARCGDPACAGGVDGELPTPGGVVVTQWLPWAALATEGLGDDALHAVLRERLAGTDPSAPGYVLGERLWGLGGLSSR